MPWTPEDTKYLLALLGCVAVVLYLVAANFGLVPSPISEVNVRPANQIIQVPADGGPDVTAEPSPTTTPRPAVTPRPRVTPRPTPRPSGGESPPPSGGPPLPPSPTPVTCVIDQVCL